MTDAHHPRASDLIARRRLPNRCPHVAFGFRHGNNEFVAGIGFHDDGSPAEIFLNGPKVGTDLETTARDSAVVASLALQYGCDLDTLRKALMRDGRGAPNSPLSAALDLLAAERDGGADE